MEFTASDVPSDIDKETAICIYRITQEALRNVVKHAKTDRARVNLTCAGGVIELSVEDRGVGFDTERARGIGIGLASMGERARFVEAGFTVESQPGGGTTVRVRAPLTRGKSAG